MILLFPAESNKSPRAELEELHELDEEDLLRKAIALSLEEKEEPHYLTGVLKMMNSSHFSKIKAFILRPPHPPSPWDTVQQLLDNFGTTLKQI